MEQLIMNEALPRNVEDYGTGAVPIDCEVHDLVKQYPGSGTRVLDGISFTIPKGQAVSLIGHNGSGKSTLLRCCNRLVEPSSGSIRLMGHEVRSLGKRALRRLRAKTGFVFQGHNLVPRLSVLSNVIHGAQAYRSGPGVWYHAFASKADRENAMECLASVGLRHLALRRADMLSGGESQRVAIARTLMQKPSIVMADEPAASLDPGAGEKIMELFIRLFSERGISLMFVSHNLSHAKSYADRILCLGKGRLVFDGESSSRSIEELRYFCDGEADCN